MNVVSSYYSGPEKSVTDKSNMKSSTLSVLLSLVCVLSSDTATIYEHIASLMRSQTKSYVYLKGKNFYERRHKVKNGLCKYIFPDTVLSKECAGWFERAGFSDILPDR